MRTLALFVLLGVASSTQAITLEEAQAEAHQWTVVRKDAIQNRVGECIGEGAPSVCHTAWAASVTENTAPADVSLSTITMDDPGRYVTGPCDSCFTGEGTFAQAGINLPATAPINAKINIAQGPGGWGTQLVIQISYDGTLYQRGYGMGIFNGFPWIELE